MATRGDFAVVRALRAAGHEVKAAVEQARDGAVQVLAITFDKIEHNKPIDDAMFSRPAVK